MIYAAAAQSWRAYLKSAPRKRRGMAGRLDSRMDWAGAGAFLEAADIAIGEASFAALDDAASHGGHRARRHFETAWRCYLDGFDGRAAAAATAAIDAERFGASDELSTDHRAHFLRGVVRLGAPDTDEPTLIDPAGAHRDFTEAARRAGLAYERAHADGRQTERLRRAAAACELAAAWASFCAGAPEGAVRRAFRAGSLAPEFSVAFYLAAKAAAVAGDPTRASEALEIAAQRDLGFIDLAAEDGDFRAADDVRKATASAFREAAQRAHAVIEGCRRDVVAAVSAIDFADGPYPAPPELFQATPFPPSGGPLATEATTVRLSLRAMIAALCEIRAAVEGELPAAELRRRALAGGGGRRARPSGASGGASGLVGPAALFGGVVGFAAAVCALALLTIPAGAEIALVAFAVGAGGSCAVLFALAARMAVRRPRAGADALRAAEARAAALEKTVMVIDGALTRLRATPSHSATARLWTAEARAKIAEASRRGGFSSAGLFEVKPGAGWPTPGIEEDADVPTTRAA